MKRKVLITINYVLALVSLVMMTGVDAVPALYIPLSINAMWFLLMLVANRKALGIYEERG